MYVVLFCCYLGLFRTHIGSSTSPVNAQVYDSPESMAHFARFASIYAQLYGYRKQLMREAKETGHPLIRYATLSFVLR
jgi:alpha-glucosidase